MKETVEPKYYLYELYDLLSCDELLLLPIDSIKPISFSSQRFSSKDFLQQEVFHVISDNLLTLLIINESVIIEELFIFSTDPSHALLYPLIDLLMAYFEV